MMSATDSAEPIWPTPARFAWCTMILRISRHCTSMSGPWLIAEGSSSSTMRLFHTPCPARKTNCPPGGPRQMRSHDVRVPPARQFQLEGKYRPGRGPKVLLWSQSEDRRPVPAMARSKDSVASCKHHRSEHQAQDGTPEQDELGPSTADGGSGGGSPVPPA